MKNRLLELLNQVNPNAKNELIADYLIENGTYCTPCNIGDYIEWRNNWGDIVLLEVTGFDFDKKGNAIQYHTKYSDIQPFVDETEIAPKERLSQERG